MHAIVYINGLSMGYPSLCLGDWEHMSYTRFYKKSSDISLFLYLIQQRVMFGYILLVEFQKRVEFEDCSKGK